ARCLAADPAQRPSAAELAAQVGALIDWTGDRTVDRTDDRAADRTDDRSENRADHRGDHRADDRTDDRADDRAAVIADPIGSAQRVAPFRTRRLARLAREAIAAGSPFAALAHCDRGLAYAPDDAELLALVAVAEAPRAAPTRRRRWPYIAGALSA